MAWDFVRQRRGRLFLEFLPEYSPELNPVEYLWSHWKHHELPNFCPQDFGQLSCQARRALCRMRRRPTQRLLGAGRTVSPLAQGDEISHAVIPNWR
jgi:transposase